ncbi:glycoside hydrolase/deacetylase [Fragilariopsis cylindrus CCMP1102]|uniref:Glycoside hydrolase/deacetylase n=1 Tax=Fragilariopsis cylindrus CCMP1102 TaxID=635003 RepID=A0A1E7F133_9STRA|nr:glycoside hydrolase/deacetylase [Fragilariopsis cylindrus CCMP1102]|eukprot:OEU11829.1 glycoside hydrolase/deacetylase [Fragilariopsis cylindrus CCMP1102]
MSETQDQLEEQQPSSTTSSSSSSSSSSSESYYVTYGVLEKNQEYVDWFRYYYFDNHHNNETKKKQDDNQDQDSSSNNNSDYETITADEDFDQHAFEQFRLWSLYNNLQYPTTSDNDKDNDDDNNKRDNVDDNNKRDNEELTAREEGSISISASASASVIGKSKIIIDGLVTAARQKKDNLKNNLRNNYNLNHHNLNLKNNVKNNLNLDPNTVSYIVFDSQWNLLRFSPRYTNIDIAILLQAAAMNEQQQQQQQRLQEQPQHKTQTQKQQNQKKLDDTGGISGDDDGGGDDGEKNKNDNDNQDDDDDNGGGNEHTSTCQNGSRSNFSSSHKRQSVVGDFDLVQIKIQQGILPIVPIRRSFFQQSILKKSVDLFFTKESIPFFACFPFRYSPRTIYRFDFVNSNNTTTTTTTTTTRTGESAAVGGETTLEEEADVEFAKTNSHTKITTTTTVAKQNIRNFVTKTSFKAKKDSLFASIQSLRRSSNLNNSKLISRTEEKSTTLLPTATIAATAATATATSPSLPSPQSQKQQPLLQDKEEDYDDEYDGYIALTIDDVPCRFNNTIKQSKMQDVLSLLKQYNAKATFMIISNYVTTAITDDQNQNQTQTQNEYQNQNNINIHQNDMIQLLQDGHELANHGIVDEAMDSLSKIEFNTAINECNDTIYQLQSLAGIKEEKVKWFRAPQARYTTTMEEVLEENNMYNVMCDCYAACPVIEDGRWIGQSLTKQVLKKNNKSRSKSGSIVLLHMPENGFREYCFLALEILLKELCVKRNYKICTVTELQQLQQQQQQSSHNNV